MILWLDFDHLLVGYVMHIEFARRVIVLPTVF